MYSFEGNIRYSETDVDCRLTVKSLIDYFQDCSVFHCESIGGGIAHLKGRGLGWMVAAWQIHIHELPSLGDHVVASTWPSTFGMTCQRAFTLERPDGTMLAEADSLWFMYDFEAGGPVHLPEDEIRKFDEDIAPGLDLPKTRMSIKAKGEGVKGTPTVVGPELLDSNGHMNNAYYINIAYEAAEMDGTPARIDAIYRNPAMRGDTIVPVVRDPEGNGTKTVELLASNGDAYSVVRLYATE
ncbi:MAG: thioesterase [Atopobiaceae bacterium]|jgi:acyl-ACP thioesterase|nr:thioesterase [Atopobiaceae bacterium]MCH4119173.1 thioesterase [Atopobiaceae bacterium]MCI1318266.1 thioesterase [Atopobiaceae bacterium]MCI1388568.1 thioesterase [Atopobiaceae bacterium]MCI1432067.1 thioesterase [Atopobiaceae bacterium]